MEPLRFNGNVLHDAILLTITVVLRFLPLLLGCAVVIALMTVLMNLIRRQPLIPSLAAVLRLAVPLALVLDVVISVRNLSAP